MKRKKDYIKFVWLFILVTLFVIGNFFLVIVGDEEGNQNNSKSIARVDNIHKNTVTDSDNDSMNSESDRIYQNNNKELPPATKCTLKQRKKIVHQLLFTDDETFDSSNPNHYGRFEMFFPFATCPKPSWISELYSHNIIELESFLGLSIGCNKGFDAIKTARMGFSDEIFDVAAWKNATSFDETSVCKQNKEDKESNKGMAMRKRSGEMHCVEPLPSTFSVLKNASDKLHLHEKGFVLTHAAISTANGVIQFPTGESSSGKENFGIHSCSSPGAKCESVSTYTLDSYVNKYVQSKGPINILQIDAEGWDFNILFGASSVLDRTHYLEFEYHIDGNWKNLHLLDAIRLLDSKGFTCYWAGRKRLWRITECYFEIYNYWHGWSNIACVHRSQHTISQRMERLFRHTLKLWLSSTSHSNRKAKKWKRTYPLSTSNQGSYKPRGSKRVGKSFHRYPKGLINTVEKKGNPLLSRLGYDMNNMLNTSAKWEQELQDKYKNGDTESVFHVNIGKEIRCDDMYVRTISDGLEEISDQQ